MNRNTKRGHVKGFTLTEMIVVLAIIGILTALLMPNMIAYYRNSRLKASNADAKMVYNAVQTEVIRYMNIDRAVVAADASGFGTGVVLCYDPSGTISCATGDCGNSVSVVSASDESPTAKACRAVVNKVNHTVSGASEVVWSVYVNNYIVQACVSAQNSSSTYVGYYSADKQVATIEDGFQPYSTVFQTRLQNVSEGYETAKINTSKNQSSAGTTGTTE